MGFSIGWARKRSSGKDKLRTKKTLPYFVGDSKIKAQAIVCQEKNSILEIFFRNLVETYAVIEPVRRLQHGALEKIDGDRAFKEKDRANDSDKLIQQRCSPLGCQLTPSAFINLSRCVRWSPSAFAAAARLPCACASASTTSERR